MIRKRKEGFWDRVSRWFLYKLVEFLKGIRNELFVIAENTKIRTIVENIRAYVHTITQAGYDGKIRLTSWGGNSIVWQQMVNDNSQAYAGLTAVVEDGRLTISGTSTTANTYRYVNDINAPGHKLLLIATNLAMKTVLRDEANNTNIYFHNSETDFGEKIITIPLNCNNASFYSLSTGATTYDIDTPLMVVDLTQLYGEGNEPYSVDQFRAMFPADYYEYSEPTIKSASVTDVALKDSEQTKDTKTVPAAVKALTGYGMATATKSNTVFWDDANSKWWYYQNVGLDAETGLPVDLNEPVITDITELMADFDHVFTNVEAGDTLTFLNSNGDGFRLPVPATLEYNIKGGTSNA